MSAMNEADHVRAIHVLSEKNPRPVIAVFHLNPNCGRAEDIDPRAPERRSEPSRDRRDG